MRIANYLSASIHRVWPSVAQQHILAHALKISSYKKVHPFFFWHLQKCGEIKWNVPCKTTVSQRQLWKDSGKETTGENITRKVDLRDKYRQRKRPKCIKARRQGGTLPGPPST